MEPKSKPNAKQAPLESTTWVPVESFNPNAMYVNHSGISSPSRNGSNGIGNPYVHVSPMPTQKEKGSMDTVKKLLSQCGKKVEHGTKQATGAATNVWHHLKTSPSVCDAAMARIVQGTKVIAEGGNNKVFQQAFGMHPGEKLQKSFACYISTSSGPVIGTLYVSTRRLAFCSDKPLCHYTATGQPEWVYYKVVVQLDQLRGLTPSANLRNPTERYIQVVTVDNHEFWFMGFVSYDKALKALNEAIQHFHHS